jgi:hypothetical protein
MTAIDNRKGDEALPTLTADAEVTDDGHHYTSRDEIEAWLESAVDNSEFTYTSKFAGATSTDVGVDVRQHLEGDFPGGSVDLHYRFTMDGALIGKLVIEP